MIRVTKGTVPDNELVTKIIKLFHSKYIPRFEKLEKYYQVKNSILDRQMASEKPNNRIAHPLAKYITNIATAYFQGKGIRYTSNNKELIEKYSEILDRNYINHINFEVAKEASKKGVAFELLYMNDANEIKIKKFDAEDIIPVYSSGVNEFLEFAIRIYKVHDIMTGKDTSYAEVYTNDEIIYYTKTGAKYREQDRVQHNWDDVPIIVYWNNEEQKGDYEDVIPLIDAYDKSQSDTANDFEYFTDAFLVLVGASDIIDAATKDNDEEDGGQKSLKTMKNERVLFLNEKGQAEWLVKNVNDTAIENYKNRIFKDIFFLSQVPNMSDESFAGNLSGVAIEYKLVGLEQLTVSKENKFIPAQKKRAKLITNFMSRFMLKAYDSNEIDLIFDRSMIQNIEERVKMVMSLDEIVSQRTKLGLLPFVKDVDEELERLQEEETYGILKGDPIPVEQVIEDDLDE